MDWYLYKNQVTQLNSRRLRLLCRMRHLLTNIRNVSHLVRDPHRLRLTFCSSLQTSSRRNYLKSQRSKKKTLSSTYSRLFGTATNDMEYGNGFQKFRFYSTSNRDTFKAEAPIGVYQNSNTFRLNLLGMRLGDSFNRLSSHINLYFKQKEVSVVDNGQEGFVCAVQEPISRMLRQRTLRTLRERRSAENRAFIRGPATEQVQEDSSNQSQGMSLTSLYPNLQLFHISSLATRFGESYNYVANHINSVFSRSPAKQDHVDVSSNDAFRGSRSKKISSPHWETWQTQQSISVASGTASADTDNNSVCSSWEEGYLHFARHINLYFGAKVEDTVKESSHNQRRPTDDHGTHMLKPSVSLDQPLLEKTNNPGSSLQPKSPGLFHMSNLTTRFGENYTYMANHINRYFKGSATLEEDDVGQGIYLEQYRGPPENTVTQEKPASLLQCLVNPLTIPSLVGSYLGIGSRSHSDQTTTAAQAPEAMLYKPALGGRRTEEMTRVLLDRLQEAIVPSSITSCVEELNAHLIQHPACKAVVWQEKAAFQLLRRRRIFWMNDKLQEAIRETLALIGYADPVKGCGIRVLSIDGGGTKGIVPLQVLKQLEAQTGKRVYQLFDYICGVSTGAVLAFMLGLTRISLDECEEMYHRFGSDVFRQNPLVGTVKMGWTHSYYNSETWEMILREKMGEQILIETARYELSPKVSAVSAVVNWGKSPKAFIFRNYNHAPGRISRYAGGSGYKMWQAVRASSAAPGYFQEFPLHGDIHQDGGLILNNPCALAVHESRLLWPNQPFQCVLSLGTGLYDNARRGPATSTSLRAKISNLICSATDTEGVHTLLEDLLEPDVYFRFNPMLSLDVTLDESRPGVLQQLQKDTQLYLDRNRLKMDGLCNVLRAERTAFWKTRDWISEKAWELQQRWA